MDSINFEKLNRDFKDMYFNTITIPDKDGKLKKVRIIPLINGDNNIGDIFFIPVDEL